MKKLVVLLALVLFGCANPCDKVCKAKGFDKGEACGIGTGCDCRCEKGITIGKEVP